MIMRAKVSRGELAIGGRDQFVRVRRVVPKVRKTHEWEVVEAGGEGDGRDRWAVDKVVAWRGKGKKREARVKQ